MVQKFKSSTSTRKALGLVAFSVWFAIGAQAAEPRKGGMLRFGINKNLATLNPFPLMQSVDHQVRSLVFENLFAVDRNLEPMPSLARSVDIAPDGMTYTFTLRPGVKFHNGKPLSPEDIKWSIEYAQEPRNRAFGQVDLMIIERVEVEEPDRVRIRLKSPFAPFLSVVGGIHLYPVVAKGSLEPGESQQNVFPPGTGPFRFVEWRPGQELRLSRFEGYWQKGLPYLDGVRFVIAVDDTSRFQAVRTGDLDVAEEISGEQVARIREGKVPGVGLAMAPAGSYRRMGINHCRPPFNNVKVRQALAFALDKQEIIDAVYSGLGTPTNQKMLRGTRWFLPEVTDRKQDLARARALLAEAGYPSGLNIEAVGRLGHEQVLQVIQAQAKKAGIEMTILIRDNATHLAAMAKADFQISMSGGTTGSDPDLAYYTAYHTPAPERRGRGGRTEPCYSNPRADQLLESARKVTDFQQRRRMYKEVVEILHEEVADLPVGFIPSAFALRAGVQNFESTIIDDIISYGNGGVLKTWLEK
jgi:peptide/nickel transport system substrate-binding protein